MKKVCYLVVVLVVFCCLSGHSLVHRVDGDGTVVVEYVGTHQLDRHAKYYRVNLTLRNEYDYPVWFVVPSYGEEKLGSDRMVMAIQPWRLNFITARTLVDEEAYAADGSLRRVVRIHFIGKNLGFYAFRLPAKASIKVRNHDIGTFKNVNSVEVVTTRDIFVNGSLPLEKFVLYEASCSDGADVDLKGSYWINVDWTDGKLVNEWGHLKVDFLGVKALAVNEVRINN